MKSKPLDRIILTYYSCNESPKVQKFSTATNKMRIRESSLMAKALKLAKSDISNLKNFFTFILRKLKRLKFLCDKRIDTKKNSQFKIKIIN